MTNCKTVSRTRFSQAQAVSRFREMADSYKRNVGRGIQKLRLNKGWTQQQLAVEIPDPKVNSQRVSEWERGINLPQKHLPALAKALGVTENHILAGEPEKAEDTTRSPLDGFSELTSEKVAGRLDRLEVEVGEIGTVVREIRSKLSAWEFRAAEVESGALIPGPLERDADAGPRETPEDVVDDIEKESDRVGDKDAPTGS